ncbi:tyrosine-type recombinase/integrase [Candidatus Bipolaricaulota bacterium]
MKSEHPLLITHSIPGVTHWQQRTATDLYRETTNIRLTQKALGHSNLATTQIYTHIVDEELEGALKSFRAAKVAA